MHRKVYPKNPAGGGAPAGPVVGTGKKLGFLSIITPITTCMMKIDDTAAMMPP